MSKKAADLFEDAKTLMKLIVDYHRDSSFAEFHAVHYEQLRESLMGDSDCQSLAPEFLKCRTASVLRSFLASISCEPIGLFLHEQMAATLDRLEQRKLLEQASKDTEANWHDPDRFMSRVIQLLMLRGAAREVAIATFGTTSLYVPENNDSYSTPWHVQIKLPATVYTQLELREREEASNKILRAAKEIPLPDDNRIASVGLVVDVAPLSDWRQHALRWLRGEGINNQGRVRSANIASRECDGLLFRSQPEIHLYRALKDAGIAFAPLPVFLRGGQTYQRIEPDFVVIQRGAVMVVEVDGDTVHQETPAEADQRTRIFKREGVLIERVRAADCDTAEKAQDCAAKLLEALDSWRAAR